MAEYHEGERAVQRRAGVAERAPSGARVLRPDIPDVAAAFLTHQPMIVLGAADPDARVWATVLAGTPGFLTAPDPGTLRIAATPLPTDPLADALAGPAKVGAIAIEPATRRRMRVNGLSTPDGSALVVHPDQVISNCPKHIQRRDFTLVPAQPRQVSRSGELTGAQQAAIRAADTFFVATVGPDGDADASHRGGNPGFVDVLSPTRLRWPDYQGNLMFLTLGNLAVDPRAGLVFPDWRDGALLQLTGTARTLWDPAVAARYPGAQRVVDFEITAVHHTTHALPLHWTTPAYDRFNPRG